VALLAQTNQARAGIIRLELRETATNSLHIEDSAHQLLWVMEQGLPPSGSSLDFHPGEPFQTFTPPEMMEVAIASQEPATLALPLFHFPENFPGKIVSSANMPSAHCVMCSRIVGISRPKFVAFLPPNSNSLLPDPILRALLRPPRV
jgi:hypothetical protein